MIFKTTSLFSTMSSDYEQRFGNVARLYSGRDSADSILQNLQSAHVCVVGLGGVGSWVVEAIARSGVGKLTLIDMDDVCVSNVNRQVMAQTSTIGKFKAEALRTRVLDINPDAQVNVELQFIRPDNAMDMLTTSLTEQIVSPASALTLKPLQSANIPSDGIVPLLKGRFDYVIDAADSAKDKAAIIDACVRSGTPVVTSGGVGGLTDPTLLTISDLAHAEGDSLIMRVRKLLRQTYLYPSGSAGERNFIDTKTDDGCEADGQNPNAETNNHNQCSDEATTESINDGVSSKPERDSENEGGKKEQSCNCGNATFRLSSTNASLGNNQRAINYDSGSNEGRDRQENAIRLALQQLLNEQSTPHFELFDAHCHLQLDPLYPHAARAVELARSKYGVQGMSVCGTSPVGDDWQRIVQLHEQFPRDVVPSFGLHPWWIHRYNQHISSENDHVETSKQQVAVTQPMSWMDQLEELLQRFPSAGVGECGLDKAVKKDVTLDEQESILIAHIQLATKYQRALTVHCVSGCWDQLLAILKRHKKYLPRSIILHSCNTLPVPLVPVFTTQGEVYFSIAANRAGPGASKLVALLAAIPRDRLLIETDSPDQLHSALRMNSKFSASGEENMNEEEAVCIQYNEPALLIYHCGALAKSMNIPTEELALLTRSNVRRAYRI